MPELRKDPITGDWTIVATERAKRPDCYVKAREPVEKAGTCPFCPGNEQMTPPAVHTIGSEDWKVRVVPNKFPALDATDDIQDPVRKIGPHETQSASGYHEVVIHTPRHVGTLGSCSPEEVFLVLRAWQDRMREMYEDPRIAFVLPIVNEGKDAGSSLPHPHSQIFATTFVPRLITREIEGITKSQATGEGCVICAIAQFEQENQARIILETDSHLAFAPYAARTPFETWVMPIDHTPRFEDVDGAELRDAATALNGALHAIEELLCRPAYNLYLHSAPTGDTEVYHWHIEIRPVLSVLAGFELGTGNTINVVRPEDAAAFLRDETDESESEQAV